MDRSQEQKLIRKAAKGHAPSIEALIRAHQDSLYAFVWRLSGRPEMAEDIVQEAFVRVLKNLDRFDTRFRFSTWVFTIAKRLYVNASQKLKPAYDTETISSWQGQSKSPGRVSAEQETLDNLREMIECAIDDLNDRQREVVILFHQQDWSIVEIAEHLSLPEGTVKSHLHRARRRMREYISRQDVMRQRAAEVFS